MAHVRIAEQLGQVLRRLQLVEAAVDGAAMRELCNRFKVDAATVYRACRDFGVTVPSDGGPVGSGRPKRHPFEVLAKLKTGLTAAQVGCECKLSRERVRQIRQYASKLGLL